MGYYGNHQTWPRPEAPDHQPLSTIPAPQLGRGQQRPLVGREQEYTLLHHALLKTEQNRNAEQTEPLPLADSDPDMSSLPGLVLCGEAGIGKTRLAEEAGRTAQSRGWTVLWNRLYTQESHIPYRFWSELLHTIWQHQLWPLASIHTGGNATEPLTNYQPLVTFLPELAAHLPVQDVSTPLAREQEKVQLWEAMVQLLHTISAHAPLLIVLDDLQWLDISSAELLAHLLRRSTHARLLLVATCRATDLPVTHPLHTLLTTLQREHLLNMLPLPALTPEEIRALIAEVPEQQAQRIQQQAAGNPFFAEELARTFSLNELQTMSSTKNTQLDRATTLPQTITGILEQRLARLSPACQQLLSHAAVIGEDFSFHVLHLLENSTKLADENTLRTLLEEALQAAILTEEQDGEQHIYAFWHPLLMNHLYERLSAARRARMHQRVATVLRQLSVPHEEEAAALITHHLLCAGADPQELLPYARMAADRAYRLFAYPDAERHYRIVCNHDATLSNHPPQLSAAELSERVFLSERLAECLRIQGKFAESRYFYEYALKMQQQHPTSDPSSYEQQALLWAEIGVTWYNVGNLEQARSCYQNGKHTLQHAGITSGPAWAYLHFQQGYTFFREGKYQDGQKHAQEALNVFEAMFAQRHQQWEATSFMTRTRRILAGDPVNLGRTRALLGMLASCLGHSAEALHHLNAALALYEKYNYQREIAIVCCNLGDLSLRKAEHARAHTFFLRSLHIAQQIGEIPATAIAFGNLGVLALHTGDLTEAETWLKRGVSLTDSFADPIYGSALRTYLASVFQEQGRLAEARVTLHLALSIARAAHTPPYTCLALITLANMRLKQALLIASTDSPTQISSQKHQDQITGTRNPSFYTYTPEERTRLLKQAQGTLQRALTLECMEAETRMEGQLLLVQVFLHLGNIQQAHHLAQQTYEEIEYYELFWLKIRAERLLAWSCAMLQQHEHIAHHFERALSTSRQQGMRLEEARVLQWYGTLLVHHPTTTQDTDQRGRHYLQQASQLFQECHAAPDDPFLHQPLTIPDEANTIAS